MLVIICGLPGTGKTTLAREVAKHIPAVHISSDAIRMMLLRKRTYSEKEKEGVYKAMFKKAEELITGGRSVVLDATFYKKMLREKARAIADKTKSKFFLVECTTPESVLRERMFARKRGESESEADFEVYKKIKEIFEPIEDEHLIVDTSQPIERQVRLVMNYLC